MFVSPAKFALPMRKAKPSCAVMASYAVASDSSRSCTPMAKPAGPPRNVPKFPVTLASNTWISDSASPK